MEGKRTFLNGGSCIGNCRREKKSEIKGYKERRKNRMSHWGLNCGKMHTYIYMRGYLKRGLPPLNSVGGVSKRELLTN